MSRWNREEIDTCFRRFMDITDRAFIEGDLEPWVQCFTEDAIYSDLGYGFNGGWDTGIRGRDAIRAWINGHFASFPNNQMAFWPVPWYVIDAERGWVICEWRNRMRDPGNGMVFEEKNYSRLKYAGNMRWSFEEDIYNPLRMRTMIELWRHERARCEAAGLPMPEPRPEQALAMHEAAWEHDLNPGWSRAEIEDAVRRFEDAGNRAFQTGDHSEWLQFYTPDVQYRELGFGFAGGWEHEIHGRAAVKQWIDPHCDLWPINRMIDFPIDWYVIDEQRGWVLLEYRNIMADPGDGTRLETRSYTRLKYGGNGQWRFEEDIYSPLRMRAMLDAWVLLNSRAGGSGGAGHSRAT